MQKEKLQKYVKFNYFSNKLLKFKQFKFILIRIIIIYVIYENNVSSMSLAQLNPENMRAKYDGICL